MSEQHQTARILAECVPELKEAFECWWRANGFASEAEALRAYVRQVTSFKSAILGTSEEQSE